MNRIRRFHQVDVFTDTPLRGNPLAVVHDAHGLDDAQMAAFARWTHLSETTFLLPPLDPLADYRVRIFTPAGELPFAGHPTLGSCQAWLWGGGQPRHAHEVVQECGVGLIRVRRTPQHPARLAFAAPPLRRTGPLEAALVDRIAQGLGVPRDEILHHQWVDNGPGWCAVMLPSAHHVLALRPPSGLLNDLKLGVVGPHAPGSSAQFEVRAFVPSLGVPEDPVTGSLNAGLAQWLMAAGLAPDRYVAAQGTALGRAGRVYLERQGEDIWVGGDVAECVTGQVKM
ncbi:MAG: PhzF family phenazine biosynthesis protein [Betaproteobacteria bacterium]|jgi:PhzF family phenazine biosynthesis protein|nr:PhzF family phenazine biosynthesis protein [Betaproteobacteria bacterium]